MPKSYYPPQSLKKALVIPRTIMDKSAGRPIFRVTLAGELSLKSGARTFRDLITSSGGYGLTTGSYSAEKIALTPLGERLAHGDQQASYDALFSIDVFSKFYEHFGGATRGIPSENVARDFLQAECSVPEGQSKVVLDNILQDAIDWCLIQDVSGGEKFVPLELAKEQLGMSSSEDKGVGDPDDGVRTIPDPIGVARPPRTNTAVAFSPGLQLNIEIHIAAETSEEKIEAIFRNMRKYLLTDHE